MKTKTITFAVCIAFTAGGAFAQSSNNDRSTGQSSRASAQMPASVLIGQAIGEIRQGLSGIPVDEFRGLVMSETDKPTWTAPGFIAEFSAAVGSRATPQSAQDFIESVDFFIGEGRIKPVAMPAIAAKRKCNVLIAEGKQAQGAACSADLSAHTIAAFAITAAHTGRQGWEVDLNGDNAQINAYLNTNAWLAEFASLVEADIAAGFKGQTLRDPDAAKIQIVKSFMAMPAKKIIGYAHKAWGTLKTARAGGTTLNTAGGNGIEWTSGGTAYACNTNGWTIARNGSPYFGEGHINGKRYDLSIENSSSNSKSNSFTSQN